MKVIAFPSLNTVYCTQRRNINMVFEGAGLHKCLGPQYHMMTSVMLSLSNIPSELSSDDKYSGVMTSSQAPLPNVEILQLSGSENLGALLWAFVLFNGLFTTIGKPGDWILPVIAKIIRQEQDEWFIDFKDGYRYQCPPLVDMIRFILFITLGFYSNTLWSASLGGDSFWGWSTGACLAIPSGLLSVARDKLPTREESKFQEALQQSLSVFLSKRVERRRNSFLKEEDLLSAFRVSRPDLRSKEVLPERMLKKALRTGLGGKPDKLGRYKGLFLSDTDLDVKYALEKAIRESRRLKEEADKALLDGGVDASEASGAKIGAGSSPDAAPLVESSGQDFVR